MREVFLSHASANVRKARRLRASLIAHGIPVWFSPHHIKGADQWQDEIGAALARCDWFIVILTPAAIKSMWVKREVRAVLIDDRFEGRIIPLLFEKCDFAALSWTLPQLQFIDFTKDYWQALKQLLGIWNKTLKKPRRKTRRKKR